MPRESPINKDKQSARKEVTKPLIQPALPSEIGKCLKPLIRPALPWQSKSAKSQDTKYTGHVPHETDEDGHKHEHEEDNDDDNDSNSNDDDKEQEDEEADTAHITHPLNKVKALSSSPVSWAEISTRDADSPMSSDNETGRRAIEHRRRVAQIRAEDEIRESTPGGADWEIEFDEEAHFTGADEQIDSEGFAAELERRERDRKGRWRRRIFRERRAG